MCIPRWFAKGHSAFAAAASSRVLSCPTARRKLSVHPSPPSPSPAQPFFPLLPRIFTSYLLSLTSFSVLLPPASSTCLTLKPLTACMRWGWGMLRHLLPLHTPPALLPTDLLQKTGNLSQKYTRHDYVPLFSSSFPSLLSDGNRGQEKSIITLQIISNIYQGNSLVITTDCKP